VIKSNYEIGRKCSTYGDNFYKYFVGKDNLLNDLDVEKITSSEISGSYGSEHEDDCLLGCCAV
jgi:hypothetical protein